MTYARSTPQPLQFMPAPTGNDNAMIHGLRAVYTTSRMPKRCGHIERRVRAYKEALTTAVGDHHGEVSIYHASVIQSASRHEAAAQLAEQWLRKQDAELDTQQRVSLLGLICKASDARDRCLKALALDQANDRGPSDPANWLPEGRLFEPPPVEPPNPPAGDSPDVGSPGTELEFAL